MNPTQTIQTLPKRRMAWSALKKIAALMFCFVFSASSFSAGTDANVLENQVKAAFLVKFAGFVQWPASTNTNAKSPFIIGILGDDPFGEFFDQAAKKESVEGRHIEVRRAKDLAALAECQMIFVNSSESARLDDIRQQLQGRAVLTVSDSPDFASRGGMIGFIKESGRIRFEINAAAATAAQLQLSAKLLQVGKIVTAAPEGGNR